MNIPQDTKKPSPMGEACSRFDLTAIHEILDNKGYRDDEGIATELSFQMWTEAMQEIHYFKKRGDSAFRGKDFTAAVDCYTLVIDDGVILLPTVFARRCLSYLMTGFPDEALRDAVEAKELYPTWPTARYLQSACLFSLGLNTDAQLELEKGTDLEAVWNYR